MYILNHNKNRHLSSFVTLEYLTIYTKAMPGSLILLCSKRKTLTQHTDIVTSTFIQLYEAFVSALLSYFDFFSLL